MATMLRHSHTSLLLSSSYCSFSGNQTGRRGVTQSGLHKTVLIKALMARLCCAINKTCALPHADVPLNKRLLLPSAFSLPVIAFEIKRREEVCVRVFVCLCVHACMCACACAGVLLVVLVVWKVCVAINSSHLHPCFLREIQSFWSWWIYWGFKLQLLSSLRSAF